jgi:predicted nucleic acid-binding protein
LQAPADAARKQSQLGSTTKFTMTVLAVEHAEAATAAEIMKELISRSDHQTLVDDQRAAGHVPFSALFCLSAGG